MAKLPVVLTEMSSDIKSGLTSVQNTSNSHK